LPDGVTAAGNQYDFSYTAANTGASVSQVGNITVQLQYDPDRISDIDELQIMHLVGSSWVLEETNRTVDTDNHTISVDVSSLSPFVAASVDSAADVISSSGGGGGGCFINTAQPDTGGVNAVLLVMLLVVMVLGAAVKKTRVQ